MEYLKRLDALKPLLASADHVDVKTAVSSVSLPEFVAGLLSYQPGWVRFLLGVRWGLVRLLGMKQEGVPGAARYRPEDVPAAPGGSIGIWTVRLTGDGLWAAETPTEKHLAAHMAIAAEPLAEGRYRYHVGTLVHYRHWTGPVYFNIIRPFHHLIVRLAVNSASKGL